MYINISKLYTDYVVCRRYEYEVLKCLNDTERTSVGIMLLWIQLGSVWKLQLHFLGS